MSPFYYRPGEHVVLRRVWQERVYRVTTLTVVQDTQDWIVLYLGPGYPLKAAKSPLQAADQQALEPELRDCRWGGGIEHLLMLIRPGASHAIYAMKDKEFHLTGWYINLQAPLVRTDFGFDTTDYLLDVTLPTDRSVWTWKDEEEFELAVAGGVIKEEMASGIRKEGELAAKQLQEFPASFVDRWRQWRPPQEWTVPELPRWA
ncbi:DUF402 domain-containing protein [Paenibacillus ginsengarvi]|uniref:DUF402 domain-containing protein n=1 Tax=Paenibacillus ginsengarvi TaxID=400777 RepID=A0A3B0CEN4_9BACL|nr:DUF402 domain-containing protein [Paenibacillus ginsengarvi]RKN84485.1 DUF402 domain-containing protein [Paenibacillus ginsengarvi]